MSVFRHTPSSRQLHTFAKLVGGHDERGDEAFVVFGFLYGVGHLDWIVTDALDMHNQVVETQIMDHKLPVHIRLIHVASAVLMASCLQSRSRWTVGALISEE